MAEYQNTALLDPLPQAIQKPHSATTDPADVPNLPEHQLELCNFFFGPAPLKSHRKNGMRSLPLGQYTTTRPPHRGTVPRGFNAREGCPLGTVSRGFNARQGCPSGTPPRALWRDLRGWAGVASSSMGVGATRRLNVFGFPVPGGQNSRMRWPDMGLPRESELSKDTHGLTRGAV